MSIVKRVSEDESALIDFLRVNNKELDKIINHIKKSSTFNILIGSEDDVIQKMTFLFKTFYTDCSQFYKDMNERLIINSIKVLKRLMGDEATFLELDRLIHNSGGMGRKILMNFARMEASTISEARENADIASWFLTDYYNEKSKTFEYCSSFRMLIFKMNSKNEFKKIFNPSLSDMSDDGYAVKAFNFLKLIKELGKTQEISSSYKFSNEERMIVLNKIMDKHNIAIIGSAGVGKTVLIDELIQDLKNEYEILSIERTFKSDDIEISKIKELVDCHTNKPKLLILDDVYSVNTVANIDYALKNNLQILIATQGSAFSENWKNDLIDLYYPKNAKHSNLLATTEFQEIFITQNRSVVI